MVKSARSPNHTVLLAERIEHLSTKRQEIIRPILEHPREYVLLSVRALAKRLHSDPATMVRIVHGLGFENYKQFQRHLHELSLAFATSLDTMRQGESDAGSGTPVGNSVSYDLKNLQGLKNTLDPQRFRRLAKRIYAARRVVILASDLASVLADYLGYQLNLLGLPIFVTSSPGAITHTAQSLTKQDLVIAISFRRGLRATVEGVQQARQRGAYCVGVADTYISPLAQNCHEMFLASIHSVSFGASYTAPIALANALLTAVGEFRRSRTMQIVRVLAEEQRKGSRWCTP
jgi:RpiR family transcriptional regulator, carbohydrate utilization regulator